MLTYIKYLQSQRDIYSDRHNLCTLTVLDSGYTDLVGITDRMLTTCVFDISLHSKPLEVRTYRDIKYLGENGFQEDCSRVDWQHIKELQNVDLKVEWLHMRVLDIFDAHAPQRTTVTRKKPCLYITDNNKLLIQMKNKAYMKYKKVMNSHT